MLHHTSIPIVILHSFCHERASTTFSETIKENKIPGDELIGDEMWNTLEASPLSCDILILPEIPSGTATKAINIDGHNDTSVTGSAVEKKVYHSSLDVGDPTESEIMRLVGEELNPCGMDNIFMLENVLFKPRPTASSLSSDGRDSLLSLTSCSVTFSYNGENLLLPVEPLPSTFSFSPKAMHSPTRSPAELNVRFNHRPAWTELLRYIDQQNHSSWRSKEGTTGDSSGNLTLMSTVSGASSDQPSDTGKVEKSTLVLKDACEDPSLSRLSDYRYAHSKSNTTCSENKTLDPRECSFYLDVCLASRAKAEYIQYPRPSQQTIMQLQKLVDQELHDLDRLLNFMAGLGVLLILSALWMAVRLQGTTDKTILSRKNNVSPPDAKKRDSPLGFRWSCRFLKLDYALVDPSKKSIKSIISSYFRTLTSTLEESKTTEQALQYLNRSKRVKNFRNTANNEDSNETKSTIYSPQRLSHVGMEESKKAGSEDLSPCSKLVSEWIQRKAIRRSKRIARNRPKLEPEPSNVLRPPPSLSRSQGITFFDPSSNPILLPANAFTINPNSIDTKIQEDTSAVKSVMSTPCLTNADPPNHKSTALMQTKIDVGVSRRQITKTSASEPSSCPPPSLPELCSTPDSVDSFINDYW